jgi:hypothetical protein
VLHLTIPAILLIVSALIAQPLLIISRPTLAAFEHPVYGQKMMMADTPDRKTGIRLLIQNLKKEFRIPENLKHYSEKDFQEAEKKFLKFCLQNGCDLGNRDLSSNKGIDDLDLAQPGE